MQLDPQSQLEMAIEGSAFTHKEFMELIRQNQNLLKELGIDINKLYSCGYYGCAFPTNDPSITAKFTTDDYELAYYEMATDIYSPILPAIFAIEHLGGDWFLVLRESIKEIDWDSLGLNEHGYSIEDLILEHIQEEASDIDENLDNKHIDDIHKFNIGLSEFDGRLILFDAHLY